MTEACDRTRILIADDDLDILDMFSRLFSADLPDCQVDTAKNGSDAFESFLASRQAVIIMDLHMPVMDGGEAFQEIQDHCTDDEVEMPTVIFCTAYDPPQLIRGLIKDQSKHSILRKPVNIDTLVTTVKAALSA
jgi:CheY-like chemotaxis protein